MHYHELASATDAINTKTEDRTYQFTEYLPHRPHRPHRRPAPLGRT